MILCIVMRNDSAFIFSHPIEQISKTTCHTRFYEIRYKI